MVEEKKVILIVEDDDVQANSLEHGLHHVLGTAHGISVKTLRAIDPTEATNQLDANDVALIVLDVNLANNTNGIDFATELREKYPYLPIIILTQNSGDSYIVNVYKKIRYADFFTKPIEWDEFASSAAFHLKAPTIPKERFLPVIDSSKKTHRISRNSFLFLRGIKQQKKIEIFTLGDTPKTPTIEITSIAKYGTYERFFNYLLNEEKDLLQCEAVTIVNRTKITKICKINHYLLLDGYEKEIPIDPKYRPQIYSLIKD